MLIVQDELVILVNNRQDYILGIDLENIEDYEEVKDRIKRS
jgi:hypothetical protein